MSDVTFMGLGLMGYALAATANKAGYDTVVWNRTPSRAEPLISEGARSLLDPAEAIAESPIVVVCVTDYAAAESFLQTPEALAALRGRVLVQLTSGSPRMAQSTHTWCHEAGAAYVDGAIMAYPSQIGESVALLLAAGDEKGFSQAEPLLRVLCPDIDYLGTDPRRAPAMDMAILSATVGVMMGVINGVALCEAMGISIERYAKHIPSMVAADADIMAESVRKIATGRLSETEAPIALWGGGPDYRTETLGDAGYNTEISVFMRSLFTRAIKQGLGELDVGALIQTLRPTNK